MAVLYNRKHLQATVVAICLFIHNTSASLSAHNAQTTGATLETKFWLLMTHDSFTHVCCVWLWRSSVSCGTGKKSSEKSHIYASLLSFQWARLESEMGLFWPLGLMFDSLV